MAPCLTETSATLNFLPAQALVATAASPLPSAWSSGPWRVGMPSVLGHFPALGPTAPSALGAASELLPLLVLVSLAAPGEFLVKFFQTGHKIWTVQALAKQWVLIKAMACWDHSSHSLGINTRAAVTGNVRKDEGCNDRF